MQSKYLIVLLATLNLMFTSTANAQYGYGMAMTQPACPYNSGAAPGANDNADEIADLNNARLDLKKDKRDSERQLKDLEAKKEKYTNSISDALQGPWSDKVIEHMENGYNCNCAPPAVVVEAPVQQAPPTVIIQQPPSAPQPYPVAPPPVEEVPPAPPREPRPSTDIFEPGKSGRMPASEVITPVTYNDPGAPPVVGTSVAGNSFDQGWGGGGNFGGGGDSGYSSMCGPDDEISQSKPWKAMCRNGGGVAKEICRIPYFLQSGSGDKRQDCADAVSNYRKVVKDADKLRSKIKSIDDQIAQIGIQIGDLKRDAAEDRKLEADCPTGDCNRPRRQASSSGSSIWSSLLPLGVGILGGLGAEYMGYEANKTNNTNLNKLGYPTQPYQAGSYGFPFFQAGIYGAVAGASQGSFGCSGQANGGGFQNGPYGNMPGMMGPGGYGNGMMGGGMFNPGMGPWGMAGPYGSSPYGMGGMAGGMMVPGMAGGYVGGMMSPGLAGGYPGGYAGGLAGIAGGYPGGYAGGLAAGYGGGMMVAGLASGFVASGVAAGGIAGGFAMGQLPGSGMMMPGYAGGYAGGMMMPSLAGGYLSPGYGSPGLVGSYAGGGFLTPFPTAYGGSPYGSLIQGQLGAYSSPYAATQAGAYQAQAGLMTEYNSLLYRMNQVNSGASSASLAGGLGGYGGLAGGYGGLVGGYGTTGYSPYGLGLSYTTSPLLGTGITGGISLDTLAGGITGTVSTIPGRSR